MSENVVLSPEILYLFFYTEEKSVLKFCGHAIFELELYSNIVSL